MFKRILFLAILILLFITTALVYFFEWGGEQSELLQNILYLIPPLLAAGAGVYAISAYGFKSIHSKPLIYITLGLSSWFIGEVLWTVLEFILKVDAFPSVADYFYLLAYPLLFIGFFKELEKGKISWTFRKKWILSAISLALFIITAYFGVYLAFDPGVAPLENLVAILYGVGDFILAVIILFILILAWEYKQGKLFFPWVCIFLGIFFTLLADTLFAVYTAQYEAGEWLFSQMDLLWLAGYSFFACGLFDMGFIVKRIQKSVLEQLK